VALKTTNWYKLNVVLLESYFLKVGKQEPNDVIKTFLAPQDSFELVDSDNDLVTAKGAGECSMLHRGALVPVPASFELSGHTINNQNSAVGLSCPCNHISDKVSVTWRVQNGKVTILSAEEPCGHLNRDTSLSLLICLVHNIRKFETWLAIFLSQLLILPHLLLVHMTKLIK